MGIRFTTRKSRPDDATVYGDATENYPLGLLTYLPLAKTWGFFPYPGFGKEIEKPARADVLRVVELRWRRDPGNPTNNPPAVRTAPRAT